MASLAEVNTMRTLMDQLNAMAGRDLRQLVAETVGRGILSPAEVTALMVDTLPALLDPYAATIAELATDFYVADRENSDSTSRFTPGVVALPEERRVAALAGWGTSVLVDQPGATGAVLDRLTGGAQRVLFDVERDTTWELAASDPEPVRYQRMTTSAEPCDFCRVLASRGAVYSAESSRGVVGRGVPVGKHKLAKGVRSRGPRAVGEDYHDNDKCVGVAVHPGRAQQMQSRAADHFEEYAAAREKVSGERPRDLVWDETKAKDGSLRRKYRWEDRATGEIVTSDTQTNRIIGAMREIRKEQES